MSSPVHFKGARVLDFHVSLISVIVEDQPTNSDVFHPTAKPETEPQEMNKSTYRPLTPKHETS